MVSDWLDMIEKGKEGLFPSCEHRETTAPEKDGERGANTRDYADL